MLKKVRSVFNFFRVYLLFLSIAVSHATSVISNLETSEEQIDDCKDSEFRCENGRCIPKLFVCDGLLDCLDGSDETYSQCQNITCDEHRFRCHYGACIKKTYQCDGIKQCVDGSDELTEICDTAATNTSIRSKRAADKSCTVPAPSADKTLTYLCADNTSLVCNSVNGLVPDLTLAEIKCASGYEKEKKDDDDEENMEYICRNSKWRPKIDQCLKTCDKLNPVNVDLRCYRNGISIPCDENTVLLQGTTVRPSCKKTHKYSGDSVPSYSEMTCKSDGKWDYELFSCVPECGRTYTNPKLLIKGGSPERFGDSPWHVAIYDKKKILICGGTIITPHLVLSAAHCFHDEREFRKSASNNANDYEVVVGKVTRNYTTKDSNVQKVYKIKKIHFSDKGFYGRFDNFQSDIAILVLEEKLNISSTVLPACVDWVALRDGIYPSDNTLGKVSGWGINEYGNYSDILATVELPFLSRRSCIETVPDDFKVFITPDKFCAGSETGPGVLQGDSGGGLLFNRNNNYYLHGIVSLKDPTSTGIAAFTNIADHVGWILKVRNEVEEESRKIAIQVQTTTKTTPRDDSVKFPQNTATKRPPVSPVPKNPETNVKTSASIALQHCKKYAEYRNVKKWIPTMASKPGYWSNVTDCVNVQPLIVGGIETKPKEYPHMAHIGYSKDDNMKNVNWICGGSLISERFVLSTAVCGIGSPPKLVPRWVSLGDLNLTSTDDDARPAVYDIIRVHNHPNYTSEALANDIALFELNTNVAMSPYVRPACLYTSTSNLVKTRGSITGWGKTEYSGKASDHLQKAVVTVLDDRQCKAIYYKAAKDFENKFLYDENSMICAGDLKGGKDSCQGDSGGPLQMPIKDLTCMWNIFGLTSFGRKCADPDYPGIYTKVAYHLDWIQSIVWP